MKTYYLDQLPAPSDLPKCVLTVGNFDGVHVGHQAMLEQVKAVAKSEGLKSAVMIFEPQPREFFSPESAPARLTNLFEKQQLLAGFDIDILIVARFDNAFRSLSAQAFADLLTKQLNVVSLVLGDDFRFGHDRTGDSQFLRDYGLPVVNLHTVTDDESEDKRISSTRIRELLSQGELTLASKLLGRDYSISGKVLDGDKIGRTLDFPTANVELNRIKPAVHGIYAVDVVVLNEQGDIITDAWQTLADDKMTEDSNRGNNISNQGISGLRAHSLFGTANIGVRPSVDKPHEWRLEVHFPEFSGDLYGL